MEYGNFMLTMEWKTTRDAAQGGVYFRFKKGRHAAEERLQDPVRQRF